jgi:dTDP-4-amino-4,6-dideoxygalactose transaminase
VLIPMFDAKRQALLLREQLHATAHDVLDGGWYILGKAVARFEEQFAGYLNAAHGIGVGNGTDALAIALKAVGVAPNAGVLCPVNTAIPTAMAIVDAGCRPVFCDVDERTLLLDPASVEAKIDDTVEAMIPVHLYGQAAPMNELLAIARKNGLAVVEDCAQAHGARLDGRMVGTFGNASAFSFYPSKNLGAAGDGGLVATNDPAVAEKTRLLRNYGLTDRYKCDELGRNSRLDDMQAAILSIKLAHLSAWNERRRAIAKRYSEILAESPVMLPPIRPDAVYHLFVIRVENRERVMRSLIDKGVSSQVHYPIPLHLQKAFEPLGYKKGDFPIAEDAIEKILSIPLFSEMTDNEVETVGQAVKESVGS